MKISSMTALITGAFLGFVVPIVSAAPAEAFLSWTVSPGTFENGVWTIPGTTTITASVVDQFGDPITGGVLYWQVCQSVGAVVIGLPAAECAERGNRARWVSAVIIEPTNLVGISPCFYAGQQTGFRLVYESRGSGFQRTTGEPFDLYAEIDCPTLP
jgi:hypothetical protein